MTLTVAPRQWEPVLIRASAGTGKTYALSQRFISLLCAGESADRILATTFTRKAAGEIQSRVMVRLAAAAVGDAQALSQLGATRDKARAALVRFVRNLHRLNICTLDSFFVRIARGFTPELGLTPGWAILDTDADRRLRAEAIRQVLNEERPQAVVDLMRMLNPGEHRRSVHVQIAGIVDRLYAVYQAQPEPAAWEWLDPPAPLNAADIPALIECLGRTELPLNRDGSVSKVWLNALRSNMEAARMGDWERFLKNGIACAVAAGESFSGKPIGPSVRQVFQPLVTHARAVLLGRLADRTRAAHRLLAAFDTHYWRLKLLAQRLSFSDITYGLARGALLGRIEEVYYRLDGCLDHLLLDEFQDTSPPQWAVLEPIAEQVLSTAQDRSFFCVGDVKQAIYGWRGGEAAIFDWIENRWPDIRVTSMNTTRRCRAEVVSAVNRVFSWLGQNQALEKHAASVERWGAFTAHETQAADAGGHVRILTSRRADRQVQASVTLADAAKVVQQIASKAPGRSIGVLMRTNHAVAQMILELRSLSPPILASEEGGNPLTDTPAVGVLMSLLRLADHPGDTAAAFHVHSSPLGALVGLTDREHATALAVGGAVRRALLDEGYGRTLERWVEQLAAAGSCDARDLRRLGQLVDMAHLYDQEATLRPSDFIRMIESRRVDDPGNTAVRVMTAHKAKGLEFDAVVLPDLEDRVGAMGSDAVVTSSDCGDLGAPSRVSRYPNETLQRQHPELREMCEQAIVRRVCESLNVLYVMMTRARYALHMIIAPPRENENTISATYAGILRCAFAAAEEKIEPRQVLFEQGSEDWHDRCPGFPAITAPPEMAIPTLRLAVDRSVRRRMLPRYSPSGVHGERQIILADRLRLDSSRGRQRGLTIHEKLRQVEWLEDATSLDPLLEPLLKRPDVRRVLSRSRYTPQAQVSLLREESFMLRDGPRLMTGQFDRLVIVSRGGRVVEAEVIDFKTDSLAAQDPGLLAKQVEFHRPQMNLYRRAAAELYGLPTESVAATLVFLGPGVVQPV